MAEQGCITTIASTISARLRCRIDRSSEQFKNTLKQSTATERINCLVVDLDIEQPNLYNVASIIHHNTFTYVLINLPALQRIHKRIAKCRLDETA